MEESTQQWLERRLAVAIGKMNGRARQQQWHCEDDWLVVYTTSRVEGGPHDGYWLVLLYKPVGKGSRVQRKGTAEQWTVVKRERHKLRREARASAERHYWLHNPKRAAKLGK